MRVIHRITVASSAPVARELAELGVSVASAGLITFHVDEANPQWSRLREWVARRGAADVVTTTFSAAELSAAPWLQMVPDWHHGYPQPDEDNFGYLRATYDLSEYCEACGVGLRQKAPFQLAGEPKWGRREILQVNWVFDEFFVAPRAWSAVFQPLGVERRRVINPRGDELQTVVQLLIDSYTDVAVEGLEVQPCAACGRAKYAPVARGALPALRYEPGGVLAKVRQWFGSGRSAHRPVLVAQQVRRLLAAERVRGVSLRPVTVAGESASRPIG